MVLGLTMALCVSCGRETAPAEVVPPALSTTEVQSTWMWRLAFDPQLDEALVQTSARRWVGLGGGQVGWLPPGGGPMGPQPAQILLRQRIVREDAAALDELGRLYNTAACRLAQRPESYGAVVPQGYLVGALACEALGDSKGAEVARSLVVTSSSRAELTGDSLEVATHHRVGSLPVLKSTVEIEGERVEYRFILPSDLAATTAALRATAPSPDPNECSGSVLLETGCGFATIVGTSVWIPTGGGDLADAGRLLGSRSGADIQLAPIEASAEEAIAAWRRALTLAAGTAPEPLDASGFALMSGWARKAMYRDLGLAVLNQGRGDLALALLEEAAGSTARLHPGLGLDPLLLSSVARARFESNELMRAVDLLAAISRQPGWELAAVVGELVARIAVLPSGSGTEVRR